MIFLFSNIFFKYLHSDRVKTKKQGKTKHSQTSKARTQLEEATSEQRVCGFVADDC